jgi:hypothetical protein
LRDIAIVVYNQDLAHCPLSSSLEREDPPNPDKGGSLAESGCARLLLRL